MSFSDTPRDAQRHLADIMESILLIESFVSGLDFPSYTADAKTKSAVERQLQIIAEAAYRLGDEASSLCPGPEWHSMRAMGNVLRHAYHRVDDAIIWDTLTDDLPTLKEAVQQALASHSSSEAPRSS